jgi:hypothetical protein
MDNNDKLDYFGFLPCEWELKFDGGIISPVSDFNEAKKIIKEKKLTDGFIYPPMEAQYSGEEKIPRTERPATLFRLPASHSILLDYAGTKEELREGPSGFIIHLLAYLFQTRLQFYDWWFTGKIPIHEDSHGGIGTLDKIVVQDFLSASYKKWNEFSKDDKKRFTNVLYMHARAFSYEWDWEEFMIEYMVFDGLWKIAQNKYKIKDEGHSKRMKILLTKFEVPVDKDKIEKIVKYLRNKLLHETLWCEGQPDSAGNQESHHLIMCLRHIINRLIPALLDYNAPFIKTPWWYTGNFLFEKSNS